MMPLYTKEHYKAVYIDVLSLPMSNLNYDYFMQFAGLDILISITLIKITSSIYVLSGRINTVIVLYLSALGSSRSILD